MEIAEFAPEAAMSALGSALESEDRQAAAQQIATSVLPVPSPALDLDTFAHRQSVLQDTAEILDMQVDAGGSSNC